VVGSLKGKKKGWLHRKQGRTGKGSVRGKSHCQAVLVTVLFSSLPPDRGIEKVPGQNGAFVCGRGEEKRRIYEGSDKGSKGSD